MSALATPDPFLAQRHNALRKANAVRIGRAALKADIRHGGTKAADILAAPPTFTDTMPVLELLMAVPHVGRSKALKWMNRGGISPAKLLGTLTARQREHLSVLARSLS